MKHLILGTAGHIDHGKTSLVKALTGVDTDRLPEEKARGITIELGFAHLSLPGGIEYGIVDVPGHERFVKTMVAGAGGMDVVMLVIAADEGVMPQTREHREICQLLGVKKGVVALTKSDMVDGDWLALAVEEVHDYLKGTFLEGARVIPVSSRTGDGIEALKSELARLAGEVQEKKASGRFRLPVDRVFTSAGFGTIVTGTLLSGEMRLGDEVEILTTGLHGRLRGIQIHGRKEETAAAGQRVAANIQGVDHTQVSRGDIIAPRGLFTATRTVDVRLHLLPSAPKELRHRASVRLHSATYEVTAQAILLDRDLLKGGEEAFVQFRLSRGVLLLPGDPFVIRTYSPPLTIGGGTVIDPAPPRRRRRNSEALALLAALHEGPDEEKVAQLISEGAYSGLGRDELELRSGLPPKRLETALSQLLNGGRILQAVREPRVFLSRQAFDELKDLLLGRLTEFLQANPLKTGMGKEELKSRLPKRCDQRIFMSLLGALEKEGKGEVERDLVKLPTRKASVGTDSHQLLEPIETALQQGGAEPPTVKDLCDTFHVREKEIMDILHLLAREGRAVKIKNDLFYAPVPLSVLRDQLTAHFRKEQEITPPQFRDLTGLSRKFMIPVLEYFDQEKLTIRIGDRRRLRKNAE